MDVENKRIEDFKSDKLFDIIYLNMVLEHVESPKLILKKLHSLLKPNGKLIFSIPDFSGIEVRIFKKYAYTLHLPFHLYHFTPSTIKNYLRTTNFKIIKIIHQNFDRDFIAPISFILKDNPDKILLKLIYTFCIKKIIRKTLIKIMINIFATLGITSRMTVIASKE